MERAREVEPRRQLSSRKLELGRFLADLRQLRERLVGIAANRQSPAAAVFGDQFVDRHKNSIEHRPSEVCCASAPTGSDRSASRSPREEGRGLG